MIHTRWSFMKRSDTSPTLKWVGSPALNEVGGSKRMRGNSSATIASPPACNAPRIASHPPTPSKLRRDQMCSPLPPSCKSAIEELPPKPRASRVQEPRVFIYGLLPCQEGGDFEFRVLRLLSRTAQPTRNCDFGNGTPGELG